jgi:hypothetical protein
MQFLFLSHYWKVTMRFNLLILNVFHLMNLSIRYIEDDFQFFNHTHFRLLQTEIHQDSLKILRGSFF